MSDTTPCDCGLCSDIETKCQCDGCRMVRSESWALLSQWAMDADDTSMDDEVTA